MEVMEEIYKYKEQDMKMDLFWSQFLFETWRQYMTHSTKKTLQNFKVGGKELAIWFFF